MDAVGNVGEAPLYPVAYPTGEVYGELEYSVVGNGGSGGGCKATVQHSSACHCAPGNVPDLVVLMVRQSDLGLNLPVALLENSSPGTAKYSEISI